jgi:hypothetical protein
VTAAIEAVAGVTEMPVSVVVAAVTVRVLVALVLPEVAVMVEVPAATPVASPVPLMVAAAVLLLDQVTDEVQFEFVLLEYEQVAAYCWVPVTAAMEAVAGDREIPVNVAAVTVKVLVALVLPEVAVMVDVPAATPVARPVVLTVAAAALLLDQVTVALQFEVVWFAYEQVAVYCCAPVPAATDAVAGESAMLERLGLVTVRAADPETPFNVAAIVALPAATPVTSPLDAAVAAAVLLLDQVTVELQFAVVLLL